MVHLRENAAQGPKGTHGNFHSEPCAQEPTLSSVGTSPVPESPQKQAQMRGIRALSLNVRPGDRVHDLLNHTKPNQRLFPYLLSLAIITNLVEFFAQFPNLHFSQMSAISPSPKFSFFPHLSFSKLGNRLSTSLIRFRMFLSVLPGHGAYQSLELTTGVPLQYERLVQKTFPISFLHPTRNACSLLSPSHLRLYLIVPPNIRMSVFAKPLRHFSFFFPSIASFCKLSIRLSMRLFHFLPRISFQRQFLARLHSICVFAYFTKPLGADNTCTCTKYKINPPGYLKTLLIPKGQFISPTHPQTIPHSFAVPLPSRNRGQE